MSRVLVACESSGRVRQAFRARGHDAWSCDLLPADDASRFHRQGDVLDILQDQWDLLIAHPPCTYLSVSGMHWTRRGKRSPLLTEAAARFFMQLAQAPIARICLENPVCVMSSRWREPDQIIQPWMFGADASKATCLWLKGLPPLQATHYVAPRVTLHKGRWWMRWANQTDSGQNRLGPSEDRWKLRSETYEGIAAAMADQWGAQLLEECML